ncbi:MAG: Fic family protein [Rickettsiales bacterium]|jgi:Fic family protein
MTYKIPTLPPKQDLENKAILKKLTKAAQALAELKGVTAIIPNQDILLNTLSLQEAKASSEIENIVTTNDELYKNDSLTKNFSSLSVKEVYNYAAALKDGYKKVKQSGLLTNNHIIEIQAAIEENNAGFRKLPGTSLINEKTQTIIYTPPQSAVEIESLMSNLEKFINEDEISDLDPLIKMAIIHHQFETIHPFYDGNGRTGRIINILYLIKQGLLDAPVLYLSRYINQNKAEYYRLLQLVRSDDSWEEWIMFILDGIEKTSKDTIYLIREIKNLMQIHKQAIREKLPKIYSQDLINAIFGHPYTKIEFIIRELGVSRITAIRYLEELVKINLMKKIKKGRDSYYINIELFDLLSNVNDKLMIINSFEHI